MGANQSVHGNPEQAPHRRDKTSGKSSACASGPYSPYSIMSTDDRTCSEERARKRARKDSEGIQLNDEEGWNNSPHDVLAPPLPLSEVFISGASCRLPESDNLEEFWHNLIEGRDMVTEDNRRWPPGLYDLPTRNGKLKDISHFDAEFFRINPAQAHAMDPQLRVLFEVAYEAIVDAGYNPVDLKGSQTGVFVGNMFMEALDATSNDSKSRQIGYGLTGACDSMLSNYLSFYFDFKGPSLTVNTACSASLAAFDLAVKSLLCGQCDYAIAAGTNLLLKPGTALHMLRLGMLAKDGMCKTFDSSADGYVRSEGIIAVLLTTKESARRAYAQVLNSMSSCDGYKVEGIAYPSSESQRELIWAVHYEAGLDPNDTFYVEAHGTGTKAGDYEECKALDEAIAKSKLGTSEKQREDDKYVMSEHGHERLQSLLVGSVKSNMGHCEAASGLAGVIKVILSYQHGLVPPNIHYKSANPRIGALLDGRLSVVTTPTPIPPNSRIGINSFGFGGAISHVILRGCERSSRTSRESDIVSKIHVPEVAMDDVAMILPLASRTEHGLQQLMDFVAAYRNDKETLTLLSRSFGHAPTDTHPHRGYVLWNDKELTTASATIPPQVNTSKQQVWFIFDGMGSQWSGIGKDLLKYDLFSDTIKRCYEALPPDVNNLIIEGQSEMAENSNQVVDEIAAVCAVSIGLVDLLRAVGVEPDGLIGHSLGELVLCYADGAFSIEECMQMAYWRIKCVIEADIPKGAMATIGLPWEEVKARCPGNVWPVCHNSLQNVTVSGEVGAIEKFVADLSEEKIFTKMVKSSGLPYHSPLMMPAVNEKTYATLRGIIKNPKPKSKRWVVSAHPLDEDPELVKCSAEFHIRSLITPVFFYEALQKIPPGSVVIEVGAHALLQAILKRSLSSNFTVVPLQDWKQSDQSVVFMKALGTCHNAGVSVNPLALVKPVELPVGPRTPSIGHLMSWEHVEEWHVPKPEHFVQSSGPISASSTLFVTKNIKIDDDKFLLFDEISSSDYKVDGSAVLPVSYLVMVVWRLFAESKERSLTDLPIHFKEMNISQPVILDNLKCPTNLLITLSTISGHFEVVLESKQLVATGTISTENSDQSKESFNTSSCTASSDEMGSPCEGYFSGYPQEDIYKELAVRGHQLGPNYKVLREILIDSLGLKRDLHGFIALPSDVEYLSKEACLFSLMDGLFQFCLLRSYEHFSDASNSCSVIKAFHNLTVDPSVLFASISPPCHLSIACTYDSDSNGHDCWTDGLSLEDVKYTKQPRATLDPPPLLERYSFLPYFPESGECMLDAKTSLATLIEIAFENLSSREVNILQVIDNKEVFDKNLLSCLNKILKICSTKRVRHDLLVIGTSKSEIPEVDGQAVLVESINQESVQQLAIHYDIIITSSMDSAQHLVESHKLSHGGFVLLALNLKLTKCVELPNFKQFNPKLIAEREFNTTESCQTQDDNSDSFQCSLLKLYHYVDAKLASSGGTTIIHVSAVGGNLSWISKIKKLLSAKDSPKRIYLVSELQSDYPSGLLGMMNCLRLEGYTNRLRCVQLDGMKWEEFVEDHTYLWDHIREGDMIMNVVSGCRVGSYAHTPLTLTSPEEVKEPISDLCAKEERFTCCADMTYIITGGLGGFGLELAEWLVGRGAQYLILTSRTGTLTPYRRRKLQILDKKVKVCEVSTLDVSDEKQAFGLVEMAADLSPGGIGGVFHLAVVLRDCLFENQSVKRFKTVLSPKSTGAINVDKALRKLASRHPHCEAPLFVAFSSASAGLGNTGQTNYAFANSSMERLCEMRSQEGLPSLAIQWGAIAEVGILHSIMGGKDIESVAGTKPQPIHSCLSCLNTILTSRDPACATVSCYIPALEITTSSTKSSTEKTCDFPTALAPTSSKKDIKLSICKVLGIRDPNRLNVDSKLNELGLDSLMNFEIRNILEKDFNVSVASSDLQLMSLGDLVEATSCKDDNDYADTSSVPASSGVVTSAKVSTSSLLISATCEVTGPVEKGGEGVEAVSSAASLSTQSSVVNVVAGQNDE